MVKLSLDVIKSNCWSNASITPNKLVDAIFKGAKGVKAGVDVKVWVIAKYCFNACNKVPNKFTVALPSNKGSSALLEPKYSLPDWIVVFPVVSKFIESVPLILTDFCEAKIKWSKVVFKTILPEFSMICFPAYWFGITGFWLLG